MPSIFPELTPMTPEPSFFCGLTAGQACLAVFHIYERHVVRKTRCLLANAYHAPPMLTGELPVQAKGARLLAVSSVKGCRLSAMCDMAVHLPLERELCPFDLAPVTSTAAQMLFGDTVAIALMQVRPSGLTATSLGL